MDKGFKDERFDHISRDRRFRKIPKHIQKVAVDERFKRMFKDKNFSGENLVDKRGRQLNIVSSESHKNLYEDSSESEDDRSKSVNKKNLHKFNKINKNSHEIKFKKEMLQLSEEQEDASSEELFGKLNVKNKNIKVNTSKVKPSKNHSLQLSKNQKKLYEVSSESNENEDKINSHKLNKMNEKSSCGKNSKKQILQLCKKQEDTSSDDDSSSAESSEELNLKDMNSRKKNSELQMLQLIKKEKLSSTDNDSDEESSAEHDSTDEELSDEEIAKSENIKEENTESNMRNSCDQNESIKKESILKNQSSHLSEIQEKFSSEDSSEESDDSDYSESDNNAGAQDKDVYHKWEELRNEAPDTDEISRRLAVCNMDWDRIKADDIYVCFKSFKPADGWINSVKIYPSEYGLKRMEDEKLKGPAELVEETLPLDEEEKEDKKGSKYHREKLRQYQINRLKYYYAVVDCDSSETANVIYEQLNGMEYESSSIIFDIRFVPDDMTFDHEPVSTADNDTDLSNYVPRLFVNTALQQVKVNLTWDETDPKRREVLQKAFTDPDSVQDDIRTYLASTSGESESEEEDKTVSKQKHLQKVEDRIAAYRKLLQTIEDDEKNEKEKYEMEITWDPSLKEKTEEIVKDKMKKEPLNPFEEMLQKKKEKRKLKNKEKKAMQKEVESHSSDGTSEEELFSKSTSIPEEKDHHAKKLAELALISESKKEVNFEEKKGKRKKKSVKELIKAKKADDFKLNVNDPRFSEIYKSELYNIDPSNPQFKKTEGNLALIKEKHRRLESDFHKKNSKKVRYC